jgi:enterochelin esterase family protein
MNAPVNGQSFQSPEVHANRSVTFRLQAPKAQKATVSVSGQNLTMSKGEGEIWTATSQPLEPGIHDYSFEVDGTRMIDPSNRNVKKWFTLASMVEIPGDPPLLTELQDVPHGIVSRLIYPSTSVGHSRPLMVYTPPGYDPTANTTYPLVVLMHGFGDDETGWTEVGRAHFIADNLIASGQIKPVVIAMPYGHPVPVPFGQRPDDYFGGNNNLYEQDITKDLLPFLQKNFRIRSEAAHRSIVGLSMGGGHAIDTGLKNTDTFSAIGAFSAAAPQLDTDNLIAQYPVLKDADAVNKALTTFWIPIGNDDFLLDRNNKFADQLKDLNIDHVYTKTDGGHEWKVWRNYLPQFLKMVVPAAN